MKEKCKKFKYVMLILLLIICFSTIKFYNFSKEVTYVINSNIYTDLEMTQYILSDLNSQLIGYQNNDTLTEQELKNIILNSNYYGLINVYNTKKYQHISKKLQHIDISSLDYYLTQLKDSNLSNQDISFHKNNLLQMSTLWQNINIDTNYNFFNSSEQLVSMLKETDKLSKLGLSKIKKS